MPKPSKRDQIVEATKKSYSGKRDTMLMGMGS